MRPVDLTILMKFYRQEAEDTKEEKYHYVITENHENQKCLEDILCFNTILF